MTDSLLPNLKKLREERGLSQTGLADAMGTSKRSVIRWEMGDSNPTLGDLKSLAKLFDVSVAYLIGETDQRRL